MYRSRQPIGFLTGIGEIIVGGVICLTGGALEVATCGGYTFALGVHEAAGIALMTHGAPQASYHSRDIGFGRRGSYTTHKNNNPFVGPVDEQIFVGDIEGNIIPVPAGHQLAGSKDGKCIQQKDSDGKATGLRKDGKGHPPSPVHKDPRSLNPHGHVLGTTNADGTPWLSIY